MQVLPHACVKQTQKNYFKEIEHQNRFTLCLFSTKSITYYISGLHLSYRHTVSVSLQGLFKNENHDFNVVCGCVKLPKIV